MKLTKAEQELIIAIRNFREAQHNPSLDLEWYAREIFEKVLDGEGDLERKEILQKERAKLRKKKK